MPTTTHSERTRGTGTGKSCRPRGTNGTQTEQAAQVHGTAEDSLLDALRANPDNTTAELATKADIGRSTAGKILARLADAGTVARIPGIATGGRRTADRWIHGDAAHSTAGGAREKTASSTQAAPTRDLGESTPTADAAKTARLAAGGLRDLVLSYLDAHPGDEFGPSQLGKTLGRSAGAINNALERLAKDGAVVKTVEAPKRFSATPEGDRPNTHAKASK